MDQLDIIDCWPWVVWSQLPLMNQGYFEVIGPFTMLMLTANIKSILFWVLGQVPGKYWNWNIYTILLLINLIWHWGNTFINVNCLKIADQQPEKLSTKLSMKLPLKLFKKVSLNFPMKVSPKLFKKFTSKLSQKLSLNCPRKCSKNSQ